MSNAKFQDLPTEEQRMPSPPEGSQSSAPEVRGSKTIAPEAREYDFDEAEYYWVSSEVLTTKSKLSDTAVVDFEKYVVAPEGQTWWLESAGELSVCTKLPAKEIEYFFFGRFMDTMGIRVPLNEFQQGVLDYLLIDSSQLAPNAWGYVKSFEAVMAYFGRSPSVRGFFATFDVFRQPDQKEPSRHGFVYLQGVRNLAWFNSVNDSNKGFKKRLFYISAVSRKAKEVIVDYDGSKVAKPRFSLSWACLGPRPILTTIAMLSLLTRVPWLVGTPKATGS